MYIDIDLCKYVYRNMCIYILVCIYIYIYIYR